LPKKKHRSFRSFDKKSGVDERCKLTKKMSVAELLLIPQNQICADCNSTNVAWANVTAGVFVCARCAGIHRGLGTHISKVKSLYLDEWEPQQIEWMKFMGNSRGNRYWECNLPNSIAKPNSESDMATRSSYITRKYVSKSFIDTDLPESHFNYDLRSDSSRQLSPRILIDSVVSNLPPYVSPSPSPSPNNRVRQRIAVLIIPGLSRIEPNFAQTFIKHLKEHFERTLPKKYKHTYPELICRGCYWAPALSNVERALMRKDAVYQIEAGRKAVIQGIAKDFDGLHSLLLGV